MKVLSVLKSSTAYFSYQCYFSVVSTFYSSEQIIKLLHTSLHSKEGLTMFSADLLAVFLKGERQVVLREFSFKKGQDVQALHHSFTISF